HRFDPLFAMCAVELLSQVADVDIDNPIEGTELAAEHGFRQLLARHDMAGIAQESFKQSELHAGQVNWNTIHPHFAGGWIELEIAHGDRVAGGRSRGSTQDGADASD